MTVYTTLNQIRAFNPCKNGWETLLSSLGKTESDDEPLALVSILESNGLRDALWCSRTVFDEHRKKIVQYAIRCAENVLPTFEKGYPDDLRPRQAIQAAKDYLAGKITKTDLEVAANAAAVWAVWAAADAAVAVANAVDAANAAANAAVAAAVDAANAAAVWAAWAAVDAALAPTDVDAAVWAAWAAEKQFQENLFREIFGEVQL